MKYRTKLYLAFVLIAIIASLLGVSILYMDARSRITASMRERITSVASTTASLLDPSLVEQVIQGGSEQTPAYQELIKNLREARDANRTDNWYVQFLYILTISPKNPNQMIFIANAEELPTETTHFGDPDLQQGHSDIRDHLNELYSPPHFITGLWGTWMTGFAPILDANGHYIATVGADISVGLVDQSLNLILMYGLFALIGSILIALIGAQILSKKVTKSLQTIYENVKEIGEGNLDAETHLTSHDEFSELAESINSMVRGLRERESMKLSFAKYVSKHVLDSIMKSDAGPKSSGERRKLTILFSDIRQFTNLSEKLPPEQVVSFLNEYFGTMIDIVFAHHGTLDKFLGDGMMVEFGAPLEDPNQELHAVEAAVEMQKKLQILCQKWKQEGKPELQVGIGVHTGYAVVGNIGSEKRMEYTAIGDTVNVASRLEQATKDLNADILLSQTTYDAVKDVFECKSLGSLALPGRSEEISVYSVSIEKPFN